MFREEKGITLVALVVTIIVLLILAGVTITLALGSNGVIGRAQQASNAWSDASKAENAALEEGSRHMENTISQYVNNYGN